MSMHSADWGRSDCCHCTRPIAGRCGCAAARVRVGLAMHSRRATQTAPAISSVTSRASSCNSCSSWYKFNRPWLALAFRRWCLPSTLLLVRTGWWNTDHVAGLQQPSAQLRRTYWRCSCTWVSSPAAATCSSLPNSSPMTSAGRKHSTCVLPVSCGRRGWWRRLWRTPTQ